MEHEPADEGRDLSVDEGLEASADALLASAETNPAPTTTWTAGDAPSTAYRVKLAAFEGPLDLLLHLIRVNDLDIFDIPILQVARQYQEYLDLMHQLDLEVAGEYLVMAATLMHIKSKMLLPRDGEETGEESEDPRADLTRQLVEYQRIKQASENLQALESVQGLVWSRGERRFEEYAGEELLVVDLYTILGAMKKVLDRLAVRERFEIRSEEFSVPEKIDWLTGLLAQGRAVSFLSLITAMQRRAEIIATFLAILELMRMKRLIALQRAAFDDILLAPPSSERADGSPVFSDDPGSVGAMTPEEAQ